ncbi:transcriptional regulator, TetR family [Chishuiella changwenlii]|jgi:AcrR family transcriptional regulator|uniref:Transcriptional regulator, TetR family n=1 Tax=Chishuiella changwenlii TaxID=1434701 RepID=A0A1M6XKV9_9FLAO|nr:TetR/AcrR family transcriptional regulator [Chishuiella changwenlii]GGF01179.1 hypothetical protein GCM10010984_18320 [Chishuiella changwenlii]SHL06445.1 transcriptional regulator, TetR family [Chishuiella changwenlii]
MKDQTEELIKNTAKRMFFTEGKFNATTQEIADEAKVNRTLINYYFRSRNNLFENVFEEAMKQEHEKSEAILHSDMTFKEKIENYIDYSLEVALEYPYLEIYLVTQINQGCAYKDHEQMDKIMKVLTKELNCEIEKGNISPIEPFQFIMNLVSLVTFPICMRPLIQESFKLDDKQYVEIISQRKQIIINTLFN